ncbi:MAG TPA: copper resistance protein CopD [Aliiroseovarius sp.]|nr:copper resistance protein CopD [Aliiroseovarius sp.]
MDFIWIILFLHVLGATIWTGGHLALSFVVLPRALKARDPKILTDFENGFEKIGMPALFAQVATGLWLALLMVPDLSDWMPPASGASHAILTKLALLLLTAGLALNAKFRVIPHLSPETLPVMAWHIRAVTLLSVLFVATGVFLENGGF